MPTKSSSSAASEQAKTQLDKFKEAARELETDDDPEHFKERLKKLAGKKPSEKSDGAL